MPRDEPLQTFTGSRASSEDEPGSDSTPQHDSDTGLTSARDLESNRRRACVLLGAALSQFPIWGFAMNYGVFQEYYSENWSLSGRKEITGIIGTTSNGVMYLSMPILFALFTRRWARWRQTAAYSGAVLSCLSFLLSSFSTNVSHLVITQGVTAALGCALIFSPTTLSLGEWFSTSNRTLAYAVTLSCKNVVGTACPFLFRGLLDHYDFRMTLRIWTAIAAGTSVLSIMLIPTHPSRLTLDDRRQRKIPWQFLAHQTFYIYTVAIILQSCGYGIPQTYLNTYAHEVALLSETSATLLLILFNIPGILSAPFFGYLVENKRFRLSASTVTAISAVSTALSAFLFWGLTSKGSMALLAIFSITFGFFAGGYSSIWGGILKEMEREAAQGNETIDTGMVYGLLNGARGIGYVVGGLASVPLLKSGNMNFLGSFGYGTAYGPLIIFTGISAAFGGWGVLWKWKNILPLI